MDEIPSYFATIELALLSSPIVKEYAIVRQRMNADDGYIRVRIQLINNDFIEASEFFVLENGSLQTIDYHHQWMDSTKQSLRRCWDSTPHFPNLPNFPHHVHLEDDSVIAGEPLSLISLLKMLENDIQKLDS